MSEPPYRKNAPETSQTIAHVHGRGITKEGQAVYENQSLQGNEEGP